MDRLLCRILRRVIAKGNLQITTAGGCKIAVGDGNGTPVAIRFATYRAEWEVPNLSSAKPMSVASW
jgi:hypothetical protein